MTNEYKDKKDKNLTAADIDMAAVICGSGKRGQCMICPLKNSPAICTEAFARYINAIRRLLNDYIRGGDNENKP